MKVCVVLILLKILDLLVTGLADINEALPHFISFQFLINKTRLAIDNINDYVLRFERILLIAMLLCHSRKLSVPSEFIMSCVSDLLVMCDMICEIIR